MNALVNWIPGFKKIQGEGATVHRPDEMIEPSFVGDARVDIPNKITEYISCTACERERPPDTARFEWMRLAVGMTLEGLVQIVCMRHNHNVTLFSPRR